MTKLKLVSNNTIEILVNGKKVGRFDKWDLDRLFNAHNGATLSLDYEI